MITVIPAYTCRVANYQSLIAANEIWCADQAPLNDLDEAEDELDDLDPESRNLPVEDRKKLMDD
ncbi:hypothetical protein IQ22_00846 [Pseudomonas duriflava]|uniref:Uncharacterized protein n=1 Tax=Pseudomonas duriflava TaxID=459528 RepID=A0A562QLN2_9PSED|nr:hypothetical protein [Pseudomonas duriflava]TWI57629.1 hypothetical protein IQ22_00846 [Pseudomonas duriflava]